MTTRKRFYFLINSLEWGGAERVIANLSGELAREHDISVITLKSGEFYELAPGVRHIALSGVKNNILMFAAIPWYVWQLRRLFAREGFDNGVSFLEIANFVHILAKRRAIISFRTNIRFFTGVLGAIYRLLIRILYPYAGRIVVNSKENRHDLARYLGISVDRVVTIYNPIDLERIDALASEPIPSDISDRLRDRFVFVTVGRLIACKHHDVILRSLAWASSVIDREWAYLVVGDGPERYRLELLAQELDISDRVVFVGAQKNVFPFLRASDCFVYASEVEGFPNVLIEAMACGLPIVTTDFKTGAREVIFGDWRDGQLSYPAFGPSGVVLDPAHFLDNFVGISGWLHILESQADGLKHFRTTSVTACWLSILI